MVLGSLAARCARSAIWFQHHVRCTHMSFHRNACGVVASIGDQDLLEHRVLCLTR